MLSPSPSLLSPSSSCHSPWSRGHIVSEQRRLNRSWLHNSDAPPPLILSIVRGTVPPPGRTVKAAIAPRYPLPLVPSPPIRVSPTCPPPTTPTIRFPPTHIVVLLPRPVTYVAVTDMFTAFPSLPKPLPQYYFHYHKRYHQHHTSHTSTNTATATISSCMSPTQSPCTTQTKANNTLAL